MIFAPKLGAPFHIEDNRVSEQPAMTTKGFHSWETKQILLQCAEASPTSGANPTSRCGRMTAEEQFFKPDPQQLEETVKSH